jgi:DNA-binding NtrC family response regulator
MKVLIAEDEAISRLKLQKQLEQWGHEVVAATDGEEAWHRSEAGAFSLVITAWIWQFYCPRGCNKGQKVGKSRSRHDTLC